MSEEQQVYELWKLLDDVDTLDDAVKSNDRAFREHTRSIIKKRHTLLTSFKLDELYDKYYSPQERKED